jgi:hypothetical protein
MNIGDFKNYVRYPMAERLYVLIREDLSIAQQAVQAGHAVAEYLLKNKPCWNNNYLIYLNVANREKLNQWANKLDFLDIPFAIFKEPDIGNEETAIAVATNNERIFKNLKLALLM